MVTRNISNNFASITNNFIDEQIEELYISNSFGAIVIDLTQFDFELGDLTINVNNNAGSVTIKTNNRTRIENKLVSFVGASNINKVVSEDFDHTIYVDGKNNLGQINII